MTDLMTAGITLTLIQGINPDGYYEVAEREIPYNLSILKTKTEIDCFE